MAEHATGRCLFLREIIARLPRGAIRHGHPVKGARPAISFTHRPVVDDRSHAGPPKELQNRDSPVGRITEGRDSGADIDMLRHHGNHDNIVTTQRDGRGTLGKIAHLSAAHGVAWNGSKTGE